MKYYFLGLGALVVVCTGCAGLEQAGTNGILAPKEHVAPPAAQLSRPGPMVDGPGPGVLPMLGQAPMGQPHMGGGYGIAPNLTTQVKFVGPSAMNVGWQAGPGFARNQVTSGNFYDFQQAAVYQLVLDGVTLPGRSGSLYPTLEVRAAHPTTLAYLQHNSVPVEINDEDLQHVNSSNMVTKVIYLPDPDFQSRAIANVETLVSTRLEPGIDPVQQAEQMGTIMLILRFGNKDLEPPASVLTPTGEISQVSYMTLDGAEGGVAPPMPIRFLQGDGVGGVPSAMIAAGGGFPGQPSMPVAGMGGLPPYGMPYTSTPIGLPGPVHLPMGGPAGLKSHTVRNTTKTRIPKPVDHFLLDAKQTPGISLPKPVKHVQYQEDHPVFGPNEVSAPAGPGAAYCPPSPYGF